MQSAKRRLLQVRPYRRIDTLILFVNRLRVRLSGEGSNTAVATLFAS